MENKSIQTIKKVTIYGERCTGTNYLEELITSNFNVTITWEYGWKHFFGFNDLKNSDDTLFIGIIRNPYTWINSFYREQHHLDKSFKNINKFLNGEFYSIHANNTENMHDRNLYTQKRYANIFEMRHTKNKFLIEDMKSLVKNYILIRYEDLIHDFLNTMNKIKEKGLETKPNIKYPLNVTYYKKEKKVDFKEKQKSNVNKIPRELIRNKLNPYYELGIFLKYL
jgi:hypothetical protein